MSISSLHFEPFSIHHIVVGHPVDFTTLSFLPGYANILAGTPAYILPGSTMVFSAIRTAPAAHAITANFCIIHHNCSHAYQHVIIYNASMHYCIVSDAHIISNYSRSFQISAVYNSTILHIYLIAKAYTVYISPYYCIKPNTTVIAHNYITCDGSVWSNITIRRPNEGFIISLE